MKKYSSGIKSNKNLEEKNDVVNDLEIKKDDELKIITLNDVMTYDYLNENEIFIMKVDLKEMNETIE